MSDSPADANPKETDSNGMDTAVPSESESFVIEVPNPELVFGLVGPIGTDMEMVQNQLGNALRAVKYDPVFIRVTDLMSKIQVDSVISDTDDPLAHYESRIKYANAVRQKCDSDDALAALAILEIRAKRREFWSLMKDNKISLKEDSPVPGKAYVLRQFKRPEEIELLRKVYGRKFIQISANMNEELRKKSLAMRMANQNAQYSRDECENFAEKLIIKDMNEAEEVHGQRVGDVFHLGDVFVNSQTEHSTSAIMTRFVNAFFGKNSISPNRNEYGAYLALSASLRSVDTSRQVGAAIFTKSGEIISLGCNEVSKAGGGSYWSDHSDPHRDVEEGSDPNRVQKRRIAFDFIKRVMKVNDPDAADLTEEKFREMMKNEALKKSLLSDISEFGRVTHAEMNAITDAARLGRVTKDSILFSTTFPCHNCAKHIVASGISKVIFIEPYPKSQALNLHPDSIALDVESADKVSFVHFEGISPRRYRDIFEKKGRKSGDGSIKEWYLGQPIPQIEDRGGAYILNEKSAIVAALRKVAAEIGVDPSTGAN